MDESWQTWVSNYLDMNDDYDIFSEYDINPLVEVFKEENLVQPELYWKSHSCDSNLTKESTTILRNNTLCYSSLEEYTGFDNTNVKQNASSENHLSSTSLSYTFSFENSTAALNIPKNQYHGKVSEHSKETEEEPYIRQPKRGRSFSQTQDHIIAERKRREELTRMFIALSAIIPGLKKMDKASVLKSAIDYVKYLQKRVNDLEEENKKRKIEPVIWLKLNKSSVSTVANDFSCTPNVLDRSHIKICPKVEAIMSAKDVLIRVMCEKQKDIFPKLLVKLEAHNLPVVCSNVLPFGNSTMIITSVAQMGHEFSLTREELVKILMEDVLECCNLQQ